LGLFDRPLWPIPVEISVPSVGQGALALETRVDDAGTRELIAKLDHAPSRACVEAERAFLAALGGDCHTPLAGHAQLLDEGRRVRFDGWVASADGVRHVRASSDARLDPKRVLAEVASQVAQEVANALLEGGAKQMLEQARANAASMKRSDPRLRG
jgi:hydroxymethylbilane synthase